MTAYSPTAVVSQLVRNIPRPARSAVPVWCGARHGFLLLCGIAVASGVVVFIEPAPYDVAILAMLLFALVLKRLSLTSAHRAPALFLTLFFATNAISLAGAPFPTAGLSYAAVTLYLAISALFFAGVACAHGSRGVRVLLNGYAIAGWFSAGVAAFSFFGLIPFQEILLRYGRAQAFFKDPNVYGPYLVPVFVYGLASLQRAKGITRILAAAAGCGLTVTGVFLSFSRGAWLNCAVAAGVFLGLQFLYGIRIRHVSARLLWPLAAVPVLLAGVALLSSGAGVKGLLDDRLGQHLYDNDRFDTQQRGIHSVLEKPLGIGPGQSEGVFDYATHSMYVRILTENGFAGFATFYAFVLWSWLRATKLALTLKDRYTRDVFALISASIVGVLINGLVIDTIHWRSFWFLLGLAWWVPRNFHQAVRK
jgi:hypothetical protein